MSCVTRRLERRHQPSKTRNIISQISPTLRVSTIHLAYGSTISTATGSMETLVWKFRCASIRTTTLMCINETSSQDVLIIMYWWTFPSKRSDIWGQVWMLGTTWTTWPVVLPTASCWLSEIAPLTVQCWVEMPLITWNWPRVEWETTNATAASCLRTWGSTWDYARHLLTIIGKSPRTTTPRTSMARTIFRQFSGLPSTCRPNHSGSESAARWETIYRCPLLMTNSRSATTSRGGHRSHPTKRTWVSGKIECLKTILYTLGKPLRFCYYSIVYLMIGSNVEILFLFWYITIVYV